MFDKISGSLSRQVKALELLKVLLEEEFSLLRENKMQDVADLELSIHKLLSQLADEKESVIASLGGGKVKDFAQMRPDNEKEILLNLYNEVDKNEQLCVRHSKMNADLSLSLLEQNEQLLKGLTEAITPKQEKTYGHKGAYHKTARPDAILLSGRL